MRTLNFAAMVAAGAALALVPFYVAAQEEAEPAAAAAPERWVRVGGSANLYDEYLDGNSVSRTGDKVTLWTRREYARGQGTSWNELEIDCVLRTQTVLAYILDDGQTVTHNSVRPHREAAPILRDSAEARIFDIVCR